MGRDLRGQGGQAAGPSARRAGKHPSTCRGCRAPIHGRGWMGPRRGRNGPSLTGCSCPWARLLSPVELGARLCFQLRPEPVALGHHAGVVRLRVGAADDAALPVGAAPGMREGELPAQRRAALVGGGPAGSGAGVPTSSPLRVPASPCRGAPAIQPGPRASCSERAPAAGFEPPSSGSSAKAPASAERGSRLSPRDGRGTSGTWL